MGAVAPKKSRTINPVPLERRLGVSQNRSSCCPCPLLEQKPRTVGEKARCVPEPIFMLSLPIAGTEAPVFPPVASQSAVRTIVRNKGVKKNVIKRT